MLHFFSRAQWTPLKKDPMKHIGFIGFGLGILILFGQTACSLLPFAPSTPAPIKTLVFDAPVSLTVRNGALLRGTSIGYAGKMPNGAAKVLIDGLVAAKQMADSLEWDGTPVPNVSVKLSTRVASFDDQAITLLGTAHIEIDNATAQAGTAPTTALMEFSAPVTYSLNKNGIIPGSKVSYVGAAKDGAQFSGIDGYPYRSTLDSLEYSGRVNPKVFVKFDLRVINYSDSTALLGGTANIKLEPPPEAKQ